MLVNIYFNPGDDGAAIEFGYRGSPCRIDLGFDATLKFHLYAIDWRPGRIAWLVDGKIVHERVGWDTTPLPHLPMRLHANLWAPRSQELSGRIDENLLPAEAKFRKISVRSWNIGKYEGNTTSRWYYWWRVRLVIERGRKTPFREIFPVMQRKSAGAASFYYILFSRLLFERKRVWITRRSIWKKINYFRTLTIICRAYPYLNYVKYGQRHGVSRHMPA